MMFRHSFHGPALAAAVCCVMIAVAGAEEPKLTPEQQAEMDAYVKAGTPGPAHQALAATAGGYEIVVRSWNAPDAPPEVNAGKATRRMILDGRVLVETLESAIAGAPYAGHGMSGYDNVAGEYWSTWMDSMSTGVIVSRGQCNATGLCEFTGGWLDPLTKAPVKARMVSRWTSPATQVFELFAPAHDGKDMKMLEITYTRK